MVSDNIVQALVLSLEGKRTLLDLSSRLGLAADPSLRDRVRADEEVIVAHIVSILYSTSMEQAVLALEGDSAQAFIDVVQGILSRGALIDEEHVRKAHRIVRKLSETCDKLPSSIFITEVIQSEMLPTSWGGFSDVYRARYGDQIVAVKHIRYSSGGSTLRDAQSMSRSSDLENLNHPNILPFIGIDREAFPNSVRMVSPWMKNGTVLQYLDGHGRANVNKLLFEIAQGIQYLHSRNIVHGDLRGVSSSHAISSY
ncbi:kinase-like domain-containing protein [Roridomyces roridus]|uniref:Kinase-like domain-containing protein n=1 Tax=Roridomyces roridus TaxID=1738132 RepID=A0AAD7FHK8_9AGAR|nr:kinase-like domain-containing protein [Roridomyces roridus]